MLQSIVDAAVSWIGRGLPLRLLKIVVHTRAAAAIAHDRFVQMQRAHTESGLRRPRETSSTIERNVKRRPSYDVFLSYCHKDSETAGAVKHALESLRPGLRIFFDRAVLKPGTSWLMEIAESLDNARRVAALYTPDYWRSPYCKDEFAAALARQNDTGKAVLFPIYVFSAPIPYLFRSFQYVDCREGDKDKLSQACVELGRTL
jgi:hypothetical protein